MPGPPAAPAALPGRKPGRIRTCSHRDHGAERYSEWQLADGLGLRAGARSTARDRRGMKRLWKDFRVRAEVSLVEAQGGVDAAADRGRGAGRTSSRASSDNNKKEETTARMGAARGPGELYLYQAQRVRQRLLEGYRREGVYSARCTSSRGGEERGGAPT